MVVAQARRGRTGSPATAVVARAAMSPEAATQVQPASRELVTPLLEPRMGYLLGRGSRSDLRREYDQVRAISMIVALGLLVPLVGGSRPLLLSGLR